MSERAKEIIMGWILLILCLAGIYLVCVATVEFSW